MKSWLLPVLLFPLAGGHQKSLPVRNFPPPVLPEPLHYADRSWPFFLQHLSFHKAPLVDYSGRVVRNQGKHYALLNFDVGNEDLQQCADALIRLRAEYLYSVGKYDAIGFHFMAGPLYTWADYRKGIRPLPARRGLTLRQTARAADTGHASLRKYLDVVFAYANTVSLYKEMKPTHRLSTGTVIIWPGNPGHCTIVIDAAVSAPGDTVYRLAEGYMPAQGIYILSNPYEPALNPWYHLAGAGPISTASCLFESYYLRTFE